ncbi:uncharacterized protein V1516DRAFT_683285 [Lipomyces oligophaga]|uniref:uncharacterized protein n=1 Tax=Lipomyces oligophaga TaxID=45792 RepID=UPI0034CDA23A
MISISTLLEHCLEQNAPKQVAVPQFTHSSADSSVPRSIVGTASAGLELSGTSPMSVPGSSSSDEYTPSLASSVSSVSSVSSLASLRLSTNSSPVLDSAARHFLPLTNSSDSSLTNSSLSLSSISTSSSTSSQRLSPTNDANTTSLLQAKLLRLKERRGSVSRRHSVGTYSAPATRPPALGARTSSSTKITKSTSTSCCQQGFCDGYTGPVSPGSLEPARVKAASLTGSSTGKVSSTETIASIVRHAERRGSFVSCLVGKRKYFLAIPK